MPKPDWLRAKAPVGDNFHDLKKLARGLGLHTVCESAQCPNIGECWNHKTATFMLLGDICTRRCGFCAVPKGRPEPIDWDEPRRVAEAVATLGLKHAVVTSVNRDDDNVGGARVFAETIREIRELIPECRVEVLIPDFQGLEEPLKIVLEAQPDVLNHNTETVPRLYRAVRSGARYERTLTLLENAKKFSPGMVTKSGVMVGLVNRRKNWSRCSAISAAAASTFLPWANICAPRATTCPLRGSIRLRNSASCGTKLCASASGTSSPDRWCAPAIMRTNRPSPLPRRGRSPRLDF